MALTDPMTRESAEARAEDGVGLALVWSRYEPERVGEMVLVEASSSGASELILGRARDGLSGEAPAHFIRARPDSRRSTGPFRTAKISRRQLRITACADGRLEIQNLGRGAMRVNGRALTTATVGVGDRIEIESRALLLCVRPPAEQGGALVENFPFGEADPLGLIGESAACWALRAKMRFLAGLDEHLLIRGPSGTGKELVAAGLHRLSRRGKARLVTCNAAAIPESLVDAEFFGHARNYPNPGMPERPGLVGEADGSTLFLDEIGELAHGLQAHLLRVMDSGEYRRLGESKSRFADVRMIAATNRGAGELKHDLAARFALAIDTPGLEARRADIPLLARDLLRDLLRDLTSDIPSATHAGPQIGLELALHLLSRDYVGHVRELRQVLATALAEARGSFLEVPRRAVVVRDGAPSKGRAEAGAGPLTPAPHGLDREEIIAALEESEWVFERTWRALGLSSRHQLRRLLQRYGIERPRLHVDPATLTREEVVAALEANGYVKTEAARALGLRSRYQLARLLRRLGVSGDG